MEFYAERIGGALRPVDQESLEEFLKLPVAKPLHVTVKQPRNAAFSRLYWALCARIARAKDVMTENISDLLKVETGHCRLVRSRKYGTIAIPQSISFAAMDDAAFREFFERCVRVVYEEWGIEPEAVADLLVPQEASLTAREGR